MDKLKNRIRRFNDNEAVKDIISCLNVFKILPDYTFKIPETYTIIYDLVYVLECIEALYENIPLTDAIKLIILYRIETPLSLCLDYMRLELESSPLCYRPYGTQQKNIFISCQAEGITMDLNYDVDLNLDKNSWIAIASQFLVFLHKLGIHPSQIDCHKNDLILTLSGINRYTSYSYIPQFYYLDIKKIINGL